MHQLFKKRLAMVRQHLIDQEPGSALVVSSSVPALRSRTTFYPYRANPNLFYLTGLKAKGLTLVVSSHKQPAFILFAPRISSEQVVWEGKPPPLKRLIRGLEVELVVSSNPAADAKRYLAGHERVYYENIPLSDGWQLCQELMRLRPFERGSFPAEFIHAEKLLADLRMIKDREEIEAIKRSIRITYEALIKITPLIRAGSSEADLAATLDYWFALQDSSPAFATIVGAGSSAATLHYEALARKLKDGELLLLDFGAEHQMYCADITRVFPVNGKFTPLQADLYSVVLRAQRAAISKVKHGVLVRKVYEAAAKELLKGLIDLKAVRGDPQRLFKKGAYRKFFPHGIGHTLGMDVHDLGNVRGNNQAVLKAGMVITIEPGLYFPSKAGKIPACGIRIEDDVLVTRSRPEVLSALIPKEIPEIESLLR